MKSCTALLIAADLCLEFFMTWCGHWVHCVTWSSVALNVDVFLFSTVSYLIHCCLYLLCPSTIVNISYCNIDIITRHCKYKGELESYVCLGCAVGKKWLWSGSRFGFAKKLRFSIWFWFYKINCGFDFFGSVLLTPSYVYASTVDARNDVLLCWIGPTNC